MILVYRRTMSPLMISVVDMLSKPLALLYSFSFVLFIACQQADNTYSTLDGQAQGTTFHIVYEDIDEPDFSIAIDSLFKLIDKSMSLWDSQSLISRLNRNETDLPLDDHFINVFQEAQKISKATHGALDVTIGPLVSAWRIGSNKNAPLPDTAMIDSILVFTGHDKVSIENGMLVKKDPRVQLDFNAIAQGYTVDLICRYLDNKGIANYLVEVGGEVRTKGVSNRNTDWQIGIDKPVDNTTDQRPLQTSIALHQKSLATSGSYRKFKEEDGRKYSHIISPVNGYPTQHNLLSVSVIADDCTTADGYATAFMVMGLENAMAYATEHKIAIYCIYADEDGEFAERTTPGFPK